MSENGQEKRETFSDIVAEIRRDIKLGNNYYAANLPDRIEAAWRREKAEWEAAACACVSDAVMSGKVAVEHVPVGNAAAMREALVAVQKKIEYLCGSFNVPNSLVAGRMEINGIINAALSAPPRQCDVGTPEEQIDLHREWCRRDNDSSYCCSDCRDCFARWAQTPYEAEEGGAE